MQLPCTSGDGSVIRARMMSPCRSNFENFELVHKTVREWRVWLIMPRLWPEQAVPEGEQTFCQNHNHTWSLVVRTRGLHVVTFQRRPEPQPYESHHGDVVCKTATAHPSCIPGLNSITVDMYKSGVLAEMQLCPNSTSLSNTVKKVKAKRKDVFS